MRLNRLFARPSAPKPVRPPDPEGAAARTVRDFLRTFAFTRPGATTCIEGLPSNHYELVQSLGWQAIAHGMNSAIQHASEEAWFLVSFNGVKLQLPRYTMRTMRHCLSSTPEGSIALWVETTHWNVMRDLLSERTLFLDIGAATGAMSVPYALISEGCSTIIAFEPSPRARQHLIRTIERNGARNITVRSEALSDVEGSSEFLELAHEHESEPWFSEGSHLAGKSRNIPECENKVIVPVTTLDRALEGMDLGAFSRVVVKIDVEGHEASVLKGGSRFLSEWRPFLSIDIHNDVATNGLTGPAVRDILEPLGYAIAEQGHVFLCEPR